MRLATWLSRYLCAILPVMLTCAGCVLTTTYYDDGKTETRMVGFIHLYAYRFSGDEARAVATRLQSFGIRLGGESGIGYFDEREVVLPFDCRIVFLVRTDAQLRAAEKTIEDGLAGRDPCVTRY